MSSPGSQAVAAPGRRVASVIAGLLALAVLITAAVVWWPLAHAWSGRTTFDLRATDTSRSTVVAVIGTDARPDDDATAQEKQVFGDRATLKGARADTVLLVRFGGGRPPQVLNLPRDLVIDPGDGGRVGRVAIAWLHGPQQFASTLCSALGIGIDAMVVAEPVAFSRAVDAIGGLDIDAPGVLRDTKAHLLPTIAGTQTLSGPQALAWVRARNTEILRNGRWVPLTDTSTTDSSRSLERTVRTEQVLNDLSGQLALHPQRLGAATTAALTGMEFSTSLTRSDVVTTVRTLATNPAEVPSVRTVDSAVPAALLTASGRSSIAAFTSDARCRSN